MKLPTSLQWALIATPVVLAGVVLVFQSSKIASLRERLDFLESEPLVNAGLGAGKLEVIDHSAGPEVVLPVLSDGKGNNEGMGPGSVLIDPESFFEDVGKLGYSASEAEFMKVLGRVSGVEPDGLRALLDYDAPIEGELRLLVDSVVIQELARVDPRGALEFVSERDMSLLHLMAVTGVVVQSAPDLAITWYQGVSEDAVAGGARDALMQSFAQSRPDRLMDFLNSLDEEKRAMSAVAAANLAEPSDELVGAMLQLAEDLETSMGQRVKRNLAASIAKQRGFEEAIGFLDSIEFSAEDRGRARLSVAVQSKEGIGNKQADWLLENIEGAPNRQKVFARLISEWAKEDFNAAGSYLNEMPESPIRDEAVASFAFRIRSEEPPSATDWAITIGNEKLRRSTLNRIYQDWVKKDPAEANDYFANAGIDVGD